MFSSLPEPGRLVVVRRRRHIVSEGRASALPTVVRTSNALTATSLVSLPSVEDDDIRGELQILWELEAGARVFEKESLREVREFDAPARLDAFLGAMRWGSVSRLPQRPTKLYCVAVTTAGAAAHRGS